MNWSQRERLYHLLPAVVRARDVEQEEPLRALLSVIESEYETLEADIQRLYENWFIETCDPWVIPYIGDLLGNTPIHEAVRSRRADVAKTIYYRRRKATLPMLADLIQDVTGWDAHVVEFFRLLAGTQHVNHVRIFPSPNIIPGQPSSRLNPRSVERAGTVNVRDLDAVDSIDGPFDILGHTADVRQGDQARGWHNLRKLGIFIWRLRSFEVERATPRPIDDTADDWRFHINPLGAAMPLFNRALVRDVTTETTGRTSELHVSGPIRPLALQQDLERCRNAQSSGKSDYVDTERSLWIERPGDEVRPENIVVMDLEEWRPPPHGLPYGDALFRLSTTDKDVGNLNEGKIPGSLVDAFDDADATLTEPSVLADQADWRWTITDETMLYVILRQHKTLKVYKACAGKVGVDPQRGRLVFAGRKKIDRDSLKVTYNWGFSADLGGGPYGRQESLLPGTVSITDGGSTLQIKLTSVGQSDSVITIEDNATYVLDDPIVLASEQHVTIQAADHCRPTLRVTAESAELVVKRPNDDKGEGGRLTLSGLLVEGAIRVKSKAIQLSIIHCTIVPGRTLNSNGMPTEPDKPSLVVESGNEQLELSIDHSIVGPLQLPASMERLTVRDAIIDAPANDDGMPSISAISSGDAEQFGPAATLQRVTVFGEVHVRELTLASEVIFTEPVIVQRRQSGCVRFSYVPPESVTPRRYRCQPDLEITREIDRRFSGTADMTAPDGVRAEVDAWLVPSFASRRYGDPAYAQLRLACPDQISAGAEDGSEIGAFSSLKQPQREANLRRRLEEYLPFGLQAAPIFVT